MLVLMQLVRRGALLILALAHLALLWRATRVGTMEVNDSPSYIAASPHRPPLYPLLLDIVALLPGDLAQSLHLVQLALGGFAIWLLMHALHKRFALDPLVSIALAILLALPYYHWQWLGNFIMSEALAYPLFLIAMYFLLEALVTASPGRLIAFFAVGVALFLTRKQFLFVFPIGFFVAAYFALRGRSWRTFFATAGLTCMALGLAPLATAAVETLVHDRQLPLMGMQLVPMPLYMLDGELPPTLSPLEREFVSKAWKALDENEMTRAAFDRQDLLHSNLALHYASHFSTSTQLVVLPVASELLLGRTYLPVNWHDLEGTYTEEEARAIDSFLLGIWKKLVLAQPERAISLYITNVVTHIGGSVLLLFLIGLTVSALFYTCATQSFVPAFLAACLLLHFGNFLFTAIFEPMYVRYAFYTGNLLFLVLLSTVLWLQRHHRSGDRRMAPRRSSG